MEKVWFQIGLWLLTPEVAVMRPIRWLARKWLGWVYVGYLPDRTTLDDLYPIQRQIKRANEIHGYWLTGHAWLTRGALSGKLGCVILPHPDTPGLQEVWGAAETPTEQPATAIPNMAKKAHELGAKVKYCRVLAGVGMTFCNPCKSDGWAHIEITHPGSKADERPTIRFARKVDEDAFLKLWGSFERLWNSELCEPYKGD